MKSCWSSIVGVALMLLSGCQCFPMYNHYANAIDDISDHHIYFDRFYNPKWDISRIGRPDWNSPFKSKVCPCATQNGTYDRYDDCNLYPPLYPHEFPSHVTPPPTIRRQRYPKRVDPDADLDTTVPPVPAPKPKPPQTSSLTTPNF